MRSSSELKLPGHVRGNVAQCVIHLSAGYLSNLVDYLENLSVDINKWHDMAEILAEAVCLHFARGVRLTKLIEGVVGLIVDMTLD